MLNKLLRKILFSFVLFIQIPINSAIVVFDLGDVLLKIDRSDIARTIGYVNIISYWCNNFRLPGDEIYYKGFDFCGYLLAIQDGIINPSQNLSELEITKLGMDCLNKYFTGKINAKKIVQTIREKINKDEYYDFFQDRIERNIIKSALDLLLPEKVAKIMKLQEEGLKIVKECKAKKHTLYIVSDLDPEVLDLMEKKYPQLFQEFDSDKIISSAHVKLSKPDLYDYFLEMMIKQNEDKQQKDKIVIIEDRKRFTDAVMKNFEGKIDVHCILHKNNWEQTKSELQKLNVI